MVTIERWHYMRILITGGAGCLGSNLVEKYIQEGHEVLVIDNFATGKRAVLPSVNGLTVLHGSIADQSLVDTAFGSFKPTLVIHSAASYKNPSDWLGDSAVNVCGTINIIKAAENNNVERLVFSRQPYVMDDRKLFLSQSIILSRLLPAMAFQKQRENDIFLCLLYQQFPFVLLI